MRYSLAIAAPLFAVAYAQADLDMGDVPDSCKAICRPIGRLSDRCDTDLRSDIDRDENRLQNQCICTNKSFDVAKIAALCADCMKQSASKHNKRDHDDDDDDDDDHDHDHDDDHADHDDLEDINRLMRICGFSSQSYSPEQTSLVNNINVQATPATNIDQLTATFGSNGPSGGAGGQTNAPQNTGTGTSTNGNAAQTTSAGGNNNGGETTIGPKPTGDNSNGDGSSGSGTGNGNSNGDGDDKDKDNKDSGAVGVAANLAMVGGAAILAAACM